MKQLYVILLCVVSVNILSSCEEDNYIDTGKANGRFDGSILEYMKADPYNWDSTVAIIERAGLQDLFNGNDAAHPAITFFGPTNHSIRQYLLNNGDGYEKISDMPEEVCKSFILQYVLPEKHMKDDFEFEVKGTNEGGSMETCMNGNDIRVFRRKTSYAGVEDAGPVALGVQTYQSAVIVIIASADIEPDNGVVHALPYTFKFGDF